MILQNHLWHSWRLTNHLIFSHTHDQIVFFLLNILRNNCWKLEIKTLVAARSRVIKLIISAFQMIITLALGINTNQSNTNRLTLRLEWDIITKIYVYEVAKNHIWWRLHIMLD